MRSESTKSQFYHFSLNTVAVAGMAGCSNRMYLYPVPPQDAITIENCFTHLKMTIGGTLVGTPIIDWVGISNTRPITNVEPDIVKKIDLSSVVDTAGLIDLRLDLSHLLTKENIGYTAEATADYTPGNQTFVYLKLIDSLKDSYGGGSVLLDLWKVDSLYTTTEIR